MKVSRLQSLLVMSSLLVAGAFAQPGPELGAHLPSQAAADGLKAYTGVDGAFMAAGLVKESFNRDDLSSLLQYPTDEVVVVSLTGAQIRAAFERSVSLYPQPNTSFLQLSGFEVSYNKSAAPDQRIVSVTVNGSPIDEKRIYQIAMPSSLGKGGLGYFKIWDKTKITKTFDHVTVESVLKDKKYADTALRWIAVG